MNAITNPKLRWRKFRRFSLVACGLTLFWPAAARATFSIVAVDTVTGAVGSAGASCISGAAIIEGAVESIGAINTQAFWNGTNQARADSLLRAGDTPDSIIGWLSANDAQNDGLNETDRQYGVVTMAGPGASAAWTGSANGFWAGHRTGITYSIQGNILLDSTVVEMMESTFVSTPGLLEDRLMATLQAAKVVGADIRCFGVGKSSISAFIKVLHPGDGPTPYLYENVSNTPDSIDPIDVLQDQFDAWRAAQIADADSSHMALNTDGIPSLGVDTAWATVTPLNSQGQPLTKGGHVSLTHTGGGTLLSTVDNGDGTFSGGVVADTLTGTDTIGAVVDAGGQQVEISQTAVLHYFLCGDADASGSVTSADIIYMVKHIFTGGFAPLPVAQSGDVDRSGSLTSADIIFLVNFVFKGGIEPCT